MADSLSHWLRLREAADHAARSLSLTQAVLQTIVVDAVHVLDLGTGTGSNVRFLAERLPRVQRWLAVDRDASLLAELATRTGEWGASLGATVRVDAGGCDIRSDRIDCRIETRRMDLHDVGDEAIFPGRHLVTASALLDLVSERWLRTLATRCRSAGASVLFALTYDGRSTCQPAEPEDELIRELLNRHQGKDKGLGGPAEGPGATACAERCFADAGYVVRTAVSDWLLGAGESEMQRVLVDGWADAALELAPGQAGAIASWRSRRLAHIDAGRSRVVVGHHDLAAWLPAR